MKNNELKVILVPTDFSDLSKNALKTAISICERQSALMILVHIIEVSRYTQSDPISAMIEYIPKLRDSAKAMIKKIWHIGHP
ncbi:MAG: universal stress protein [Bacteroidales bacterium]|nr:universal stress protein [Bacteroidales bacterium]